MSSVILGRARGRPWWVCSLWLSSLWVAACADPSVAVHFSIPDDYRDAVRRVTLELYLPLAENSFDCDDLAFGLVSAEALQASRIQEAVVDDRRGLSLRGIPRIGTKIFVARALDQQGLAVVAGCGQVGVIDGDVDVRLTGEPTTIVTVPATDPSLPLPEDLRVAVTNAAGDALAGIEYRWVAIGPGGILDQGEGQSDAAGRFRVPPRDAPTPGPVVVDLQVRWERDPVDHVAAFQAWPVVFEGDLPGIGDNLRTSEGIYQTGPFGPGGEQGFVALGPRFGVLNLTRNALVAYYDAQLDGFRSATSEELTGAETLGQIERNGRRFAFTITPNQWVEIDSTGALSSFASPKPGAPATRIVPAGPCESDQEYSFALVAFGGDDFELVAANRQIVPSVVDNLDGNARLLGSGCVAAGDGALHRTWVFSVAAFEQLVVTDFDGLRIGMLSVVPRISFTPDLPADEAHLLAANVELDGSSLDRYRLVAVGESDLQLATIDSLPLPSLPLSASAADVDDDGRTDIAALVAFGPSDVRSDVRIVMSLGVQHLGRSVVGLSPAYSMADPSLASFDFDNDGHDDFLLASPTEFKVLRSGAR